MKNIHSMLNEKKKPTNQVCLLVNFIEYRVRLHMYRKYQE